MCCCYLGNWCALQSDRAGASRMLNSHPRFNSKPSAGSSKPWSAEFVALSLCLSLSLVPLPHSPPLQGAPKSLHLSPWDPDVQHFCLFLVQGLGFREISGLRFESSKFPLCFVLPKPPNRVLETPKSGNHSIARDLRPTSPL